MYNLTMGGREFRAFCNENVQHGERRFPYGRIDMAHGTGQVPGDDLEGGRELSVVDGRQYGRQQFDGQFAYVQFAVQRQTRRGL